MNDYVCHPLIRLPDDVGELSWHSVLSQMSTEGLPVNAVERLFIVYAVNIQGRITLKGLFQNDAELRSDLCTISFRKPDCWSRRCGSTAPFTSIRFRRMRLNIVL
ncbi:hypothetical protein DPMN_167987 [Dreissena polymorpha]|uniref:Uncharacterized protein n=1 Tax=Dreissena polymorpha TaxID=45954 RepID=A0A9D4IYV8_DREPO|nr:hypothetical protein DPMN_167987 [Dreissena polymorpha]